MRRNPPPTPLITMLRKLADDLEDRKFDVHEQGAVCVSEFTIPENLCDPEMEAKRLTFNLVLVDHRPFI